MIKPTITAVTVSVEVSDKEYGNGKSFFMNLQARYPEPGQPIEDVDDVISDGLDMYFAAWRTLLAGRYASGQIGGTEFKETVASSSSRLEQMRRYFKAHDRRNGQQQ